MFLMFMARLFGLQILFGGNKLPSNARKVKNAIEYATRFVLSKKIGRNVMKPRFVTDEYMNEYIISNTCCLGISSIIKNEDGTTTYTWMHDLFVITINLDEGVELDDFFREYQGGKVLYEQFNL